MSKLFEDWNGDWGRIVCHSQHDSHSSPSLHDVFFMTGWNGRAGKGKDLLVLIVSLIVNLDCRRDRIYSHLGDKLLGLSVRMFPEKFIQGTPSLMGVTIPWAGRRMEVEYHHHPSLSASWLRMQCDQPPHDLTAVPSPSCWTMSTRTVSLVKCIVKCIVRAIKSM